MKHDEKPTYNGWSNHETWAVNLWISNEEGSYRYWTDRTRELIAECADEDADRSALSRLAEELKESVHESCAIDKASLAADLMNAALGEVDWCEIARSMIDDETPPAPEPERIDPPLTTGDQPSEYEVLASYTRADALADGTLIDVTPTAKQAGFRYPVALTQAAWGRCVEIPTGVTGQDQAGRLWDVLTMMGHASRSAGKGRREVRFQVFVLNDNRSPKPVQLKSVCGPSDDLSPCVTVMLPEED